MKSLAIVQDFGAVDADNDPLLFDSFEDHEAYQSARRRTHFLIVGRKGSGKTAIFKKLLEIKDPAYFCFGHTFSDYPWQYHDKAGGTALAFGFAGAALRCLRVQGLYLACPPSCWEGKP